jgi:hypothetical protein
MEENMYNSYIMEIDTKTYVPEKGLLAGILERAFRDIFSSDYAEFKSAMAWFRMRGSDPTDLRFTYDEVKDYLELSGAETAYIQKIVNQHQHYIDDIHEFRRDRIPLVQPGKSRISLNGIRYTAQPSYTARVHR